MTKLIANAGFGAGGSRLGVRARSASLGRVSLLASTALVGMAFWAAPAAAQQVVALPGGGLILRPNGSSAPTVNDQTASGGGIQITNVAQNAPLTIGNVTINETVNGPTPDALHIEGSTSGPNSTGITLTGLNSLTTTIAGGAALYVTTNANLGIGFTAGHSFTGSYGINAQVPSGYISLDTAGYNATFVANGTHVAGVNAVTGINANIRLAGSTITGFDTGINSSNFYGSYIQTTGGSINALVAGIRTDATGGASTVESQSAIVAPTGIYVTGTNGGFVTTSGGGTINSTSAGTGTGILVASSGGTNNVVVNVGAAIGGTTAFLNGVNASNSGTGTVSVTTTAAINATQFGITATSAAATGNAITANANVTGSGLAAIQAMGQGFTVTVGNAATITGSGANSRVIIVQSGDGTVINNGTIQNLDANANSAIQFGQAGIVTNTGTITYTGNQLGAIYAISGLTVTNSGTIAATGAQTIAIYSNGSGTATTSVTNLAGGTINGTIGLQNTGTGTNTLDLRAGSSTGGVVSGSGGTTTTTLAGTLTGAFTVQSGTGANNFTLTSIGSMQGATFGSANDTFTWQGGTIGGVVNAGAGTADAFVSNLSGGSASLDMSKLSNFESYTHQSGTLTLTGNNNGNYGWVGSSGTTFNVSGTIDNVSNSAYVISVFNNPGSTVNILSGGLLSGSQSGVQFNGPALGTFSNSGSLSVLGDGIASVSGRLSITNNSGASISSSQYGGIFLAFGGGVISNSGSISGGTDSSYGYALRSSNATGAGNTVLITNNAGGLMTGGPGGIQMSGTGAMTVTNSGVITGTSNGSAAGIQHTNTGTLNITNNSGGIIAGIGLGLYEASSGPMNVTNSGTIGSGTVTGGVFTANTTGFGIQLGSGSIDNSGTIVGGGRGVALLPNSTASVINRAGSISSSNDDAVVAFGADTLINAQGATIQSTVNAGISFLLNGSGTVTNAGTLIGGSTATGYAFLSNTTGATTFNNYGSATGSQGGIGATGAGGVTVNLYAGSTTGGIALGNGNDTLAIYNGRGTASTATVDAPSGITLQNAGTLAAASFGTINLGGGTNTLMLRGTGDGTAANGSMGSFSIATSNGAAILTKADSGTWTLTGAAITPGLTINAGIGGAPGSGGVLIFNGTTGLTGAITVNGATIRAATAGAFGTGTITTVDPTIQYGATGTYANNIVLNSTNTVTDPTNIQADNGVTATLSGNITEGSALQPLVFNVAGSTGIVVLTGTNTYTGATTIAGGTLELAGGAALADTTAVTVATGGTLLLDASETVGSLSGSGTVNVLANRLTTGGDNSSTTFAGTIIDTSPLTYVGSWDLENGAGWGTNPPVYSGQQAAAFLFGGLAANYQISTAGSALSSLNRTAYYDQYGLSVILAADTARVDGGTAGYNQQGDMSAYVHDHGGSYINYAFTGGISLGGGLTKTGTGTMTLTGVSTYTGDTIVSGGTLAVSGTGSISGSTVVDNATFDIAGHTGGTSIVNLLGSGTVTLGANVLTLSNGSGTFSGNIGGTGGLTKAGAGTYILTGTGSWTGTTTISGGTLQGTTASIGGSSIVDNAALVYNQSTNGSVAAAVSGTGTLSKQGTGTVTLSGANSYSGVTTVSAGTLQGTTATFSAASAIVDNATLAFVQSASGSFAPGISGTGVLTVSGLTSGNTLTFNGALTNSGGMSIYDTSSVTINAGARGGIYEFGAGNRTLTIGGGAATNSTANTNGSGLWIQTTSGTTTVNVSAGATLATTAVSGNRDGVTALSTSAITNRGTISSSFNAGIALAGGGSIDNLGTITGGSGGNGYGIAVTNGSASSLVLETGSSITGGSGALLLAGTGTGVNGTTVSNAGNVSASGTAITQSGGGTTTITNLSGGKIVGGQSAINADVVTINNSGLIGAGTLSGGVYTAGGSGFGVQLAGGTIVNSGTINGAGAAILSTGALTLTNTGTLLSRSTGADPKDGVWITGAATVLNKGSISSATYTGIVLAGGGTLTNATGGSIVGGSDATYGVAIQLQGAATTVDNYGSLTGTSGAVLRSGSFDDTINLFAGSATGLITLGGGNDTVSIYNGRGTSDIATVDLATGLTLQNAGTLAAASVGTINLGGGSNTLALRGTGDGTAANGAAGSFNLATATNVTALNKLDTGTWTLTGVSASPGATIAVGGGTLVVNGSTASTTNVAFGGTLTGAGTVGAVTIADGGSLSGTQGNTLTMASLGLTSGSIVNATFGAPGGNALFAVTGNLTLDGTLNIADTGAFGFGVYRLATYGGTLTDNGINIGATPAGSQRVLVQTSVAGLVNVINAPNELLFWDGGNVALHDNGAVNGGSGIWSTTSPNWTDSSGLYDDAMAPQPGFAIFQAAPGTVTVDNSAGAVSVTGMQFASNGYVVTGDAIALVGPGPVIRVGDGTGLGASFTATIGSTLTGTTGLQKTDLGTLILTGANNWSGTTTISGGVLQGSSTSISGTSISNNATLAYVQPASGTVMQNISGTGAVRISGLAAGETLTFSGVSAVNGGFTVTDTSAIANTGTISNGIALTGGGTFTNAGTAQYLTNSGAVAGTFINSGALTSGVFNSGALSVTNAAGGTIGNGVSSTGAATALTLVNAGSVTSTATAVYVTAGSLSVTNQAGGAITTTGGNAIYVQGGSATVINAGNLQGSTVYTGVYLTGAASNLTLTNNAGGTISGYDGVRFVTGTVDNSGTITGLTNNGITALGAAVVNNLAGGVITSTASGGWGIDGQGATLTATNAGMINADSGVVKVGGTGTLANSGAINGTQNGVLTVNAGNLAVTNTGTITSNVNGLQFVAGGSVINDAGAISGGTNGIVSGGGALNVTNNATLSGGTYAIVSTGTFADTIVLGQASTTTGTVSLGAGDDALTVFGGASVAGILDGGDGIDTFTADGSVSSALDIGSVINFESRTKNGTGTLTLTGLDGSPAGWAINAGVLSVSGGSAINDAVAVTVNAPGTLDLANDEAIGSLSGSGNVTLGANTLVTGYNDASTLFSGVASGSGGLTKVGAGTFTLSGANTYIGTTAVLGGTLALGASNVLADTSMVVVNAPSILDLGANDDTVGSLYLSGTLNGSGTLTAAQYQLDGGTVNGNLGAGALLVTGAGVSTLNGSSAATIVDLSSGTLLLGASNRLSDAAYVLVRSGATLDLQGFSDTIATADLRGVLNGTGTLSAGEYDLTAATVNANLGTGNLFQLGGTSTLNGTAAATSVAITGGTLLLGASNRLSDTAAVNVASGGVLNLAAFSDTVGTAVIGGTLNGTGTLTAGQYQLTGGTVNANLGNGTLFQLSGTSTLNGTAAAGTVNVNGGTLTLGASDRLANAASVSVASGAILNLAANSDTVGLLVLNGTLNGTGTLTASQYQLTGATVNANLGAGTLFQLGGVSILNGTALATPVAINGGTLVLGASNRLSDTATVSIANGAVLDLGAFSDTVGLLQSSGSLNGTGTLTASQYQLTGATINANLGAGTLFQLGGVSTLNGTAAGNLVMVNAGTLALGASDRLADGATVVVASGAILNLGAPLATVPVNETVALLQLNGSLNGNGTLTAAQYQLTGASVNANLGTGTLFQLGGTSTLSGTANFATVAVNAGTLKLGASNRIADGAQVNVASGASFDLAGFSDSVATLTGNGTVALGTGALSVGNTNADFGFGGAATGTGDLIKVGTGTFTYLGTAATTARLNANAGTLLFAGTSSGGARIQGGTLSGGGTFAGNLLLASGTLSPGMTGQAIAGFNVGSFTASGGIYAVDFAGTTGGFASDQVVATGAIALSGGTVTPTATAASANYNANQEYLILKGTSLSGTFANGSTFGQVAGSTDLYWRLRYDLTTSGVVLEVRKVFDYAAGLGTGASANQMGVGAALNGGLLSGSDAWVGVLNSIGGLSAADRAKTYDSIGGEALADITSSIVMQGNRFTDLLRGRFANNAVNNGNIGAAIAMIDGTATTGAIRAAQPTEGGSSLARTNGLNAWVQGFGADGSIGGRSGTQKVNDFAAGVAVGLELKSDTLTIGVAGSVSDLEANVRTRLSSNKSTLYQGGLYLAYDNGRTYANVSGSYFGGTIDTARTVAIGSTIVGKAIGNARTSGYAGGATLGQRIGLGGNMFFTPQVGANVVTVTRNAFTESGVGVLSLAVNREQRTLYSGTAEGRLSHRGVTASGGVVEPYVSVGVRVNFGDRDTLSSMRFSGAPTGTGAFTIEGAMLPKTSAILSAGLNANPSDRVSIGVDVGGSFGKNQQEGRVGLHLKIGF